MSLYNVWAMSGQTLYDKLWSNHLVHEDAEGNCLIYIDRHLIHEVTSPQAFDSLRSRGLKPWRTDSIQAVADHSVPTVGRGHPIRDPVARLQVETLGKNCREFGINYFPMNDVRQGIVHVIGPEQGITLPGMTVVCGDSHTSTHGAFATFSLGIGTSDVEHVLATQCLQIKKAKCMRINVTGALPPGVTAKDIILKLIGEIGVAGGTGFVFEYAGSAIRALSVEERMTVCNMSIEAGARAGMIAFDDRVGRYFSGRPFAPSGKLWEKALGQWQSLHSDENAQFDAEVRLVAEEIEPQVTWGTSPEMVVSVSGRVPAPERFSDSVQADTCRRALDYMGLAANTAVQDISIDKVFIGSCTNGRIEDLRAAAQVVKGRKIAQNVRLAMVVPGSGLVKRQAEEEGLNQHFKAAGFQWRDPGCSMCLGMNDDLLEPGERCAATSNRNFEGRQGRGGRTHLVSPAMAAAAAIAGHFVDVRDWPELS